MSQPVAATPVRVVSISDALARLHQPVAARGQRPEAQQKTRVARTTKASNFYRRQDGGAWYFRRTINGIPVNVSTGEVTLERARRKGAEIEREVRDKGHGWITSDLTLAEWWPQYDKLYLSRKKKRTRDVDLRALPFVEDHKAYKLSAITPDMVTAWVVEREGAISALTGRKYKPNTVRMDLHAVRRCFRQAVKSGHLRVNPCDDVKAPRKEVRKRKLGLDEQDLLLPVLEGEARIAITVLLGTGLRRGELGALTPSMIVGGSIVLPAELTKTEKGRRVPLHASTLALLESQRERRGLAPSDPVTCLWTTKPADWLYALHAGAKVAGLTERLTLHDLRRTYGSRCAEAGMSPKALMVLLGHTKIEMTLTYYVDHDAAEIALQLGRVDLGFGPLAVTAEAPVAKGVTGKGKSAKSRRKTAV